MTVEPADTPLFDGSGTGHIRLDEVRLPREHLVGRVGRGMTSFATHIAVERLTGTLWGVALCTRTLRRTKEYLQGRAYGDGTLWQLESIRQRFAAVLLRTHELAALVDRLGERVAGRHDTAAAALLKASAALRSPPSWPNAPNSRAPKASPPAAPSGPGPRRRCGASAAAPRRSS